MRKARLLFGAFFVVYVVAQYALGALHPIGLNPAQPSLVVWGGSCATYFVLRRACGGRMPRV